LPPLDDTDESVTTAGYGFDVPRRVSGIEERLAKARYGGVEASIEVNHCPVGPEPANQFFPADYFPWTFEKCSQNHERLFLKPDAEALLPKFGPREVHLEHSETENLGNR